MFLVNDHPVLRRSLHAFLTQREDILVVGETDNRHSTLNQLNEMAAADQLPDVALVDLAMPGMGGLTTTAEISRHHPDLHVLVLTNLATERLVPDALNAGAKGYLGKNVSPEAVAAAIRTAARRNKPRGSTKKEEQRAQPG